MTGYLAHCLVRAHLHQASPMESLENGLQLHSGTISLFSMRTESLASSQSCPGVDADAQCKQALKQARVDYGAHLSSISLKGFTYLVEGPVLLQEVHYSLKRAPLFPF